MKNFATSVLGVLLKNSIRVVVSVLILIVTGMGYSMFKQQEALKKIKSDLIGQQQAYEQLSQNYAKLGTDYVNQKQLAEEAKKNWQKELANNKQLREQLRGVATAQFSIKSLPVTGEPDILVPGPDGYLFHEVRYPQNENGGWGPPVGYVKIANGTGQVTSKQYDHDIVIDSAITVDQESGKVNVYTKGFYVMRELSINAETPENPDGEYFNWQDVRYPLPITGGKLTYTPGDPPITDRLPRRLQWTPHLNVGAFGGATMTGPAWGGHVDVTFGGYGRTKNDLDYKFLGVGVNANNDYLDLNVVPAYWRFSNVLPLVSNVYVGAGAGFGSRGTNYFVTLGATL